MFFWMEVLVVKKVKVVKLYSDVVLNKIIEAGEVLVVEDGRAEHLVNEKVAEYVPERKATEKKA